MSRMKYVGSSGVALLLLALVAGPLARAEVIQTLDSVDAITSKSVLEMRVGGALPDDCEPDDYACVDTSLPSAAPLLPGIPASASFAACQRAGDHRMYCVLNSFTSGNTIKQPVARWSSTGNYEALFDCTDPKLNLDRKKANPCTTISAALNGDIWLGGRDGTAYSVIKVVEVPQGDACPAGFNGVGTMERLSADFSGNFDYCLLRYASGRPILVDMSVIDEKVGKGFEAPNVTPGAGVLLLEDRKTVSFLPDRVDGGGNPVKLAPVDIASGKTVWALSGGETLQSASLMQVNCTGSACDNYAVATSSTGRVMAKQVDVVSGSALELGPTRNVVSLPLCSSTTTTQQAWVRVSPQSGGIFVSDRCQGVVRSYVVPSPYLQASTWTESTSPLATTPATSATVTLNTLSVAPGIPVNLADCDTDPCVFYPNGGDTNNNIGAQISNVTVELLTGQTGMTVFRITGVPDCRFISPAICLGPNGSDPDYAVEIIDGQKYLHVERLLPLEITSLFDANTSPTLAGLELLIGPQFRARPDRGNTFDAFFGRTEDGVRFRETFDLDFDIRQLYGEDPEVTPTRCGFLNADPLQQDPENWDVIATTSERHLLAGINNRTGAPGAMTLRYRDMLVNTDCENPSNGSGTRWSLYAYGLMMAECVDGLGNIIDSDSESTTNRAAILACRKAFVPLADRLFDDLERARALTACANVDGNPPTGGSDSGWPLSASTCTALATDWAGARPKLTKCLEATTDPKSSALNESCQAFDTQFRQFRSRLDAAVVNGAVVNGLQTGDVANRLGELKSRVKVFLHVLNDQMISSVPSGGFPMQ